MPITKEEISDKLDSNYELFKEETVERWWRLRRQLPEEVFNLTDVPNMQIHLFGEATKTYRDGYFFSSIVFCATTLEGALKIKLQVDYSFFKLINKANEDNIFNDDQKNDAHIIRRLRNSIAHTDVKEFIIIAEEMGLSCDILNMDPDDIFTQEIKTTVIRQKLAEWVILHSYPLLRCLVE